MIKHNVKPNTQEWLDLRAQFRTASEAAIVLGISPFTTPEQFKLIKAGLKKQYYSKAMQQGHQLEAKVRTFCDYYFNKTFKEEVWSNNGFLASLDGIDGETLVEIKVSDRTYNDLKNGINPEYYAVQVQQQLYCSPAEVGYIVAYSPKADDYAIGEAIELDQSVIEDIQRAWSIFDSLPIPDQPIDMSDDGAVINLFHEYQSLKQQADEIAARMTEIKNQLIDTSQGLGLEAQGYKLTPKKGSITYDYKKAVTDAGIDLDPYKKEGKPSFTLTLPKSPFDE